METAYLRSLVLVAQTGSMAEAARRQHLTPAAIAQQIHALEREWDTRLLVRSGRTMQATEAGHLLLDKAREILRQIDSLAASLREDHVAGELRLGTINSALHSMLPAMLGRMANAYPLARVVIESGFSAQLVACVQAGTLDAAICLHPDYALPKSLEWKQLREEPLVVLAPNKLAGRPALELLRQQPFIRYDRQLGGGRQADRYLRKHCITPHERFELSSLLAIAMMVDEGLGVSLVPNIASPLTSHLHVSAIKIRDMGQARRFGIIWPRASARTSMVSAFVAQSPS
jgi:DNA-binding transcriptional LysR family regulator